MTSKISYIKLIRENLRHRAWLAVLLFVALFLAMPLYALLWLDSFLADAANYSVIPPDILEQAARAFPGLINGRSSIFTFGLIFVSPVLCSLSGYSWIHSREKEDFFLSLPVRRIQWFLSSCISGIILFVVPYMFCTALVVAAGHAHGIMSAQLAGRCVLTALCCIACFLMLYAVCTVACMLTGKTAAALLAALTVTVYPYVICLLPHMLLNRFFHSYYTVSSESLWEQAAYFSPFSLCGRLTLNFYGDFPSAAFTAAVILSFILLSAAALLYRCYPSEAAGNALAFPRTAPVFKILICIPLSLYASFFIQNYTVTPGAGWTAALSLIAVVLLCGIMDFICQPDLKLMLKRWKSSLACILSVALILSILTFDLTGYDRRIPKESSLESVSFRPSGFMTYFSRTGCIEETKSPLPYSVPSENISPLYRLAQTGIANLENGITPQTAFLNAEKDSLETMVHTVFAYRLKSGRTVFRQYAVDYDSTLDTLIELCEDEEFRRNLFPVFELDRSIIKSASIQDLYGTTYSNHELTAEEIDGLLDALEKDTLRADIRKMEESEPLGELILWVPDSSRAVPTPWTGVQADKTSLADDSDSRLTGNSFYIYPEFANTLDYLKQCGHPLPASLDLSEITSVTLTFSKESVQDGTMGKVYGLLSDTARSGHTGFRDGSATWTVTDSRDIGVILQYLHPVTNHLIKPAVFTGDYMAIHYVDGSSPELQVVFDPSA